MTTFDLAEALDLLARTPKAVRVLLEHIPDPWARAYEGENTWSPFDVVGHFVHGEKTDWVVRAKIILEHGDAQAFESFDRRGHETWWDGWTLDAMLDEFERLRAGNLDAVRGLELDDAKLGLPGMHPELGPVTMRQLLAAWVVHDLHHLGQITRAMAKRYANDVGAWKPYLTVLSR